MLLGGSPASKRFSELVLSNTIQSVGAVAGNVPAQLLYDQVLGGPKKDR